MNAMVLGAGLGRRMLPLTLQMPKPAIPVLGRPMVVQVLQRLALWGVTRTVINLHHLPDQLKALLGHGGLNGLPSIEFSFEETILGTGGGLRKAAPLLRGQGPLVVCNCDFLADIDIEAAMQAHARSGNLATLVLIPARPGYSVVEVATDGQILSLAGQPHAEPVRVAEHCLFTGMHIIDERVLDLIPGPGPSSIVTDVYRGLAAKGRLGAFMHSGFWWEFGSPSLYLEGSLRLFDLDLEQRLAVAEHDKIEKVRGARIALGPGAEIDDSAEILGCAAFGFTSRIGEDCSVEDSVIMPESWIGPDCRIRRCVIAQGLEISAGFEAENALVCADPGVGADLPAATRRSGSYLIHPLDPAG